MATSHDPRSGAILVTTLWTISLITALAMATSATFRGFASIVALDRDRTRADALLNAGLELSGGIIAKWVDKQPLTERETLLSLSTGTVQIELSDEGSRIDINNAPVPVLSSMLQSIGAGKSANILAKEIEAWRALAVTSPRARGLPTAPVSAPVSQGDTGKKKDKDGLRAFTDIYQLAQVPGMSAEYIEAILPLATVFGDDKVNFLTAPPDVITALPGVGAGQLAPFLGARDHSPVNADSLLQMLGPAKEYVKAGTRPVASVVLTARLSDGYAQAAKAIIVAVPKDKEPYRVLSWTPLAPSDRHGALPGEGL